MKVLALATLISAALVTSAVAKNVALVIGNSTYANTSALPNPVNDAGVFSAFLRASGYEVTTIADATRAEMSAALTAFSQTLRAEDTAVFYYAGHGLQLDGENYLVGVEASLMSEFDVPAETVQLNSILALMEAKAKVAIIFIDACRNNPLAENLARTATRSVSRGLALVEPTGDGAMIAFAAGPGQVAYDGSGSNSPFTAALVHNLGTPGVEVATAFKRVIAEVRVLTENRQSPQIVSSLSTEIYFGGLPEGGIVAAPTIDVAELDFAKAERLGTARGYQLFIEKHPEGFFAELARQALTLLLGTGDDTLTPEEAEARLELNLEMRREIQIALNDLGYSLGNPDGVFGRNSRREIARYQLAAGLQETGFVSGAVLSRLGIPLVSDGAMVFSADEARRYKVADLDGLETDPRLLKAIGCLGNREVKYGFYRGRVYIAVLSYGMEYEDVLDEARRCGGDLASIEDAEENNFLYSLFRDDDRFMEIQGRGAASAIAGPIFGFQQSPEGREPGGGWHWSDGSEVTFTNWERGEPSNNIPDEEHAAFWAHNQTIRENEPLMMSRPGWNDVLGAPAYIMEIN